MEVATIMEDFAGAKYDSLSILNKSMDEGK